MLPTFTIPTISALAFVIAGWAMTKVEVGLPAWAPYAAFAMAGALLLLAFGLTWWGQAQNRYRLSRKQGQSITDFLQGQDWEAQTVVVRYKDHCAECRKYALQIADILTKVGWRGQIGTTLDERDDLTGLHLVVQSLDAKPNGAKVIEAAFRQAGINLQPTPAEGPLGGHVILFVYPKN